MTRDAAAIGRGLAPGRPARPIRVGERIHVVGAAGAGASAAALLARQAGGAPDGCDSGGPSTYTPALEAAGIPLSWTHDAGHVTRVPPPDRLAVTKALTAVAPDHPELTAARAAGIPLEPWQQVVADAAAGRRLVGVAGTHGKSTTAGWLVHLLVAAGADPSAFVGALLPASLTGGVAATARWGGGEAFVVEADEYAGNFDPYQPEVAVLTSVEWDHPDVFPDLDAVVAAFAGWLLKGSGRGSGDGRDQAGVTGIGRPTIVANVGDPGVRRVLDVVIASGWDGRLIAVSLEPTPGDAPAGMSGLLLPDVGASATGVESRGAATIGGRSRVSGERLGPLVGRVVRSDPDGTDLEIAGMEGPGGGGRRGGGRRVRLPTAGRHNAANALCVAGAAWGLGIDPAAIATGLATFAGVGRRLERKGDVAGVTVYDDYAHHPTAIRETLTAVRQREPGRRVWAVYEPLTYHRTAALLDAFADVLTSADGVAIADIWAGRDTDTTVTSAQALAEAVSARRPEVAVAAPGSVEATAAWLASEVRSGDVVLVMGGGRSYRIGELLLAELGRAR